MLSRKIVVNTVTAGHAAPPRCRPPTAKTPVKIAISRGIGKGPEGNIMVTILGGKDGKSAAYLSISRANPYVSHRGYDWMMMFVVAGMLAGCMALLARRKELFAKATGQIHGSMQIIRRTGYRFYAKNFVPPPKRII